MSAYPSFGRGGGGDNGGTDSEGFTLARNGRSGRGGRGSISAMLARFWRGDGGGRGRGSGRGDKNQSQYQFEHLNGEEYDDADEGDEEEDINHFDDEEDLTITEKHAINEKHAQAAKKAKEDKIEDEMKEFVDGLYGGEFIPEAEFLGKKKDNDDSQTKAMEGVIPEVQVLIVQPAQEGGEDPPSQKVGVREIPTETSGMQQDGDNNTNANETDGGSKAALTPVEHNGQDGSDPHMNEMVGVETVIQKKRQLSIDDSDYKQNSTETETSETTATVDKPSGTAPSAQTATDPNAATDQEKEEDIAGIKKSARRAQPIDTGQR
jgi:hypothetical protein